MISFVMLTWNRRKFVEEMLNSFHQNISNEIAYEFLIIENGSNDGTVELLKQSSAKDPSIKAIYNTKNRGLNEYKKLFSKSQGDFIVVMDDDVIEFPPHFDKTLVEYITAYQDFGFIALDVIQDEFTNGAKPGAAFYQDVIRGNKIISEGPAGGWCAIFRRSDYRKIKFLFGLSGKLNMKKGEDGRLCFFFKKILGLKRGIIKGEKCLHACGPYYSNKYGYLDRDIEKYQISKLDQGVDSYVAYKEKRE